MKQKVHEPTPYEMAMHDFQAATREYQRAQTNFNNALPEYFEIANDELTIARTRLDACHKKLKAMSN